MHRSAQTLNPTGSREEEIMHRSAPNITCLYSLQHMTAREGGDNTQYKASCSAHVHFVDISDSNLQPHALMACTVYVFKDTRPYRIVTKRHLKKKKKT